MEDLIIFTTPAGFEDLVTVRPLTFSTLSQTKDATIAAYSGTSMDSDKKSTTITVVNSDVKNNIGLSFEIPKAGYARNPVFLK